MIDSDYQDNDKVRTARDRYIVTVKSPGGWTPMG